jgi:putative Holliday junction resolvase
VLAFDFGAKRIGVAVGELALGIAHPLATISFEDNHRRVEAIAKLIDEWRPSCLVVGMPATETSDAHPLCARIRRFARRLEGRFGLPVELIDETLSSWSASRKLSGIGVAAKSQKQLLDAMAACAILETWFEHKRPGTTLPRKPW